jgi:cytochrome P450
MTKEVSAPPADWDPTAPDVLADQRTAYDELRSRCPVARDASGTWLLTGHEPVRRAALDDATFSNAVSRFRNVPNSMDGDEHRRFRAVIDRFFEPQRLAALVPSFRQVGEEAVAALPRDVAIDAVHDLGAIVAVRAQSRWLGWPAALERVLLAWIHDSYDAARSSSPARTGDIALRFDTIVRDQVVSRQQALQSGAPVTDVTSELMTSFVEDPAAPGGRRLLTEAEVVSVLRNWTAGDLGTIARALGVVVHYLATNPKVQAELRARIADSDATGRAIDEMLRIDDPFVANRRVTTRDVEVGGRTVPRGSRVALSWIAANRDPSVFGDPDAYRPDANAAHNLVYGVGRHVCPGRGLATHEMREAVAALLRATTTVALADNEPCIRETPPVSGYARVPVILRS